MPYQHSARLPDSINRDSEGAKNAKGPSASLLRVLGVFAVQLFSLRPRTGVTRH
jgi:hypothetical protein